MRFSARTRPRVAGTWLLGVDVTTERVETWAPILYDDNGKPVVWGARTAAGYLLVGEGDSLAVEPVGGIGRPTTFNAEIVKGLD